jgi:short-subunit dehydrogenase
MSLKRNLTKKTVLITGASSGLGEALAYGFAKKKCKLILIARRSDKLKEISKKINKLGSKAVCFQLDIANEQAVERSISNLLKETGFIDILILNAGIGEAQLAQNFSLKSMKKIFATNLFGNLHIMEKCLPLMQRANKGIIVGISSLASYKGMPASGIYSASKAAFSSFMQSAQIDLLATNIDLIEVDPYFIATEMTNKKLSRSNILWSTSTDAAKKIIQGIEKGKNEIAFPYLFKMFLYFFKVIPAKWWLFFWKVIKRGG